MKSVTDTLLKDLGFELEEQAMNEFILPENMANLPFNTFHFGDKALKVHITNLIHEYGVEAIIDELIVRTK